MSTFDVLKKIKREKNLALSLSLVIFYKHTFQTNKNRLKKMFLNDQFYLRKLFLLVICILVIYLYYSSRQFAHRFVFPNNLNVSKRIVNKIRTRTFTD